MSFEVNEVSLIDKGRLIRSGGGTGLPSETITYQQFLAKSDAEQLAYTGYVTGWPMENGSAYALVSEGYAIGEQNGVPVTSGSPYYENNAKYWAEWTANAIGIALNTEY